MDTVLCKYCLTELKVGQIQKHKCPHVKTKHEKDIDKFIRSTKLARRYFGRDN